ncbi:hypothetical protein GCM10009541_23760 [Micromonospora gifhornensis]|uniref:Secreted protein n=1 Tax=Micromonospora gifhornensis TaxID=84594 RepID=A0ABQ4IH72_9ACTN|nr:hypothetical protein Vgi01_39270 [Micromonospora gifhornensis]
MSAWGSAVTGFLLPWDWRTGGHVGGRRAGGDVGASDLSGADSEPGVGSVVVQTGWCARESTPGPSASTAAGAHSARSPKATLAHTGVKAVSNRLHATPIM